MAAARARRCLSGAPSARAFKELEYQTLKTWSRTRRVVAKAEVMAAGDNPRFVVTHLPAAGFADEEPTRFHAAPLYEGFYCARGDMENVLKQQVLDLPGARMSAHDLAGNQLRLWLATLAYLLLERLRSVYLRGSELARATVGTIRVKLLKLAAQVKVSVRRVHVQLCSSHPLQELFRHCHAAQDRHQAVGDAVDDGEQDQTVNVADACRQHRHRWQGQRPWHRHLERSRYRHRQHRQH